jgi:hypothetical protein
LASIGRYGGVGDDERPVEHPWLAWTHPADGVRIGTARQEPDADVGRGLAGAHHDVLAGGLVEVHEVVDGDDPGDLLDCEARRRLRGDVRGEVARVDDAAPLGHLESLAGDA